MAWAADAVGAARLRAMRMRVVVAVMAAATLVACGSDPTVPMITILPLNQVEPAVAAIESALGGPQRYTEINLGPDFVNLFVMVDETTERPYVYRGGALDPPGDTMVIPAGVRSFALDTVELDRVTGFGRLLGAELPDARIMRLALLDADPVGLAWQAGIQGAQGGTFQVAISPAGVIIGALPMGEQVAA